MLIVNLDNSSATYSQGEVVSGQVSFERADLTSPLSVAVEVAGRTKTKVVSSPDDAYGEADLFCTRVAEMHGSQIVLPFAFTFPARASPVDPTIVNMTHWTNQLTTVRSNHLLPPTFKHRNAKFEASVEYSIRASVWTQSQFGPPQRRISEKIVPITYRPRYDPENQIPTKGDAIRLKTRIPSKKNPGSKAKALLHWTKRAALDFQLQLTVPAKIHPGEEIPTSLSIIPPSAAPPGLENISFVLKGFRISVKRKTRVWGAGHTGSDETQSESAVLFNGETNDLNVSLSPETGYKKDILSPALADTAPTFETYNIKRTYVMRVAAEVLCGGVMREVSGETDLVVLPGASPERVEGVGYQHNSALPSYAEAASNIVQAVSSIIG
ncbi:uncharacterized protein BJX67DRAFT_348435 [Aspergillus lucknowensis]|uniref:Arrestin-like N-terminal domain-containing protein n=1 Tax=Aspergillus lucknowensis TaxID=176173 RepID=A0ABR4M079_9EURO